MSLSDLLILFFLTKIKIFTEVFPYDRHGHRKKTCILDNDCRNCVPLGPKGDKGAQGVKGDKGQAASSGVKYMFGGERRHALMVLRLSIKVKKGDDSPSFNSYHIQVNSQGNKH